MQSALAGISALSRLSKIKNHLTASKSRCRKYTIAALAGVAAYKAIKAHGYGGIKKSIKNEHVYITGAGSGIGKIIAKKLARLGANITATDINLDSVKNTVKEIELDGKEAQAIQVDVSDPKSIKESASIAKERFGPITILINNAGIVSGKKILEVSNEMAKKTLEVNTLSNIYTIKEFLPDMLEMNKGHVVTIASAAGFVGTPGLADYTASKSGAISIDDSLRQELTELNSDVKTTCVCPYFINTGMFDGVKTKFPSLMPIVSAEWASQRIVDGILNEEPLVIFPWFIENALWIKGIVPTKVYDGLLKFFGVHDVMKDFKGRK